MVGRGMTNHTSGTDNKPTHFRVEGFGRRSWSDLGSTWGVNVSCLIFTRQWQWVCNLYFCVLCAQTNAHWERLNCLSVRLQAVWLITANFRVMGWYCQLLVRVLVSCHHPFCTKPALNSVTCIWSGLSYRKWVNETNSGCCMTLRKAGDLWIWKRKHSIALCGELAVEEAMDLSQEWMSERMKEQTVYIIDCKFSQYLLSAWCITLCKLRCDPLFLQSCVA